jgi:hypothetical protein
MAAIDYFLNGNLVLQALNYALTVTAIPPREWGSLVFGKVLF